MSAPVQRSPWSVRTDPTAMVGRWWRSQRRAWQRKRLKDPSLAFLFDSPLEDEWVSLDCETTGLNVQTDEIIAIGAVRIQGNRILTSQRLELLVRPSREGQFTAASVRVHGLRERDVAQGLEPEEALRRLLEFIGNRTLVGYFLEFDVAMINRLCQRVQGFALPHERVEVSALYYDYKHDLLPPYQQGTDIDLRFATLMKDLQLPERAAHNALNDAVMAAMAFVKLRALMERDESWTSIRRL